MNELKELCEKVLNDVEKGDPRPLKMLENGAIVPNDSAFTAANSAERLAKACLILSEALEQFQLGHEHGPNLKYTRPMGDGYGWCDFCLTKVSWGPGLAEEALSKANEICRGEE